MELIQSFVNVRKFLNFIPRLPAKFTKLFRRGGLHLARNSWSESWCWTKCRIFQFINFFFHFLDANCSHSPASFTCLFSWLTLVPLIFIINNYFSESFVKFRFCGIARHVRSNLFSNYYLKTSLIFFLNEPRETFSYKYCFNNKHYLLPFTYFGLIFIGKLMLWN